MKFSVVRSFLLSLRFYFGYLYVAQFTAKTFPRLFLVLERFRETGNSGSSRFILGGRW